MAITDYGYGQYIWNRLLDTFGNENGVAGLMGNLYAESSLLPYRKQGDFTGGFRDSLIYTNDVNNGTKSEYTFVHDSVGYGLAQWTYFSRKQGYYNYWKNGGYSSVGDINLGIDYLIVELNGDYNHVGNVIRNASTIREASDYVLHQFENPKDQSTAVELKRFSYATDCYNLFSGGSPTPPIPPTPPVPTRRRKMPLYMMVHPRF